MKTSTKNTIITGAFSVVVAIISLFAGGHIQSNQIESTITESGIITTDTYDNTTNVIDKLLNQYTELQTTYNSVNAEYITLKTEHDSLLKEREELINKISILESENTSLNNKLAIKNAIENNEPLTISPDKYLFDDEPYMVEHVNLYMRNNNRDTIYDNGDYYYNSGFRMVSNGENYEKGMSITPQSNTQSSIYYNLKSEYNTLLGSIAFEDKNSDRIDKNYDIFFLW